MRKPRKIVFVNNRTHILNIDKKKSILVFPHLLGDHKITTNYETKEDVMPALAEQQKQQ